MSNLPLDEPSTAEKVALIRGRNAELVGLVRSATTFDKAGKFKVNLEFKDEEDLAMRFLQAVADCKVLLEHIDGK